MMAEWLAGIDIGQVNFNGGDVNRLQRVMERYRGVRIGGAIDDNAQSPELVSVKYLENAIAALKAGNNPDPAETKAIGCTIKVKS